MDHLVFTEPGRVQWQEAADPVLPDERAALIRPTAVARCDLDLPMAAFGIFPGPYPVGHEVAGVVAAVGADVRGVAVGDRVTVPFQVSCGACPECAAARFAACEPNRARAGAAFGFGESGGGHGGAVADLLLVPAADHMLLRTPDAIPDEVACLIPDNVADGYRAVAPGLARRPGDDVLIVGADALSISLYAIAAAQALGAGAVRYADGDPERLAAAAALGAEAIEITEWPRRLERAGVVVAGSLSPDGLMTAVRSTAPYGVLTSVVIHFTPEVPMPLLEMYTRGITFHTSRVESRGLLPELLDLVASGRLDPRVVPTTVAPWDRAADAWLEPALKLVLHRGA